LNYYKEENTSITDATDKNKKSAKQYNRHASYVGVVQRGGHAVYSFTASEIKLANTSGSPQYPQLILSDVIEKAI
jgi:hypothetical protein